MTAHDTLRWGDVETLNSGKLNADEGSGVLIASTKQLVAAHWRWPITWNCQVAINLDLGAGENVTFTFNLDLNVGVGQGVMRFVKSYVIAPVAGVYPNFVLDNFNLPAQDIQARVSVSTSGAPNSNRDNLQFGFFVAPLTEPHAMTHMLEEYIKSQPESPPVFMPAGFHDEPLRYRGNR